MNKLFDVAIVGAGPGGCAAALALRHSNLNILLLDKSAFPRDKVCGDAIPGLAVKTLTEMDATLGRELDRLPAAELSRSTAVHVNHQRPVVYNWVTRAYTCAREDFDHWLLGAVRERVALNFVPGVSITRVSRGERGVQLVSKDGRTFNARTVIGADGAHSVVGSQLAGNRMDRDHHGGAVRAYYSGVSGLKHEHLEIYTHPDYLPGYFWMFPLPDGRANVGFGMHSLDIAKSDIKLRHSLENFVRDTPALVGRFATARRHGGVRGFGLPFASQRVRVAGDRFVLVGDAASLVDPMTGDGIGQAIVSGRLAGEAIAEALANGDTGAAALSVYTDRLWERFGPEMQRRTRWLATYRRFPWLLNLFGFLGRFRW